MKKEKFKQITLGHEAKVYIEECFSKGKTLGKLFRSFINLSNGLITTELPDIVSNWDPNNFEGGFVYKNERVDKTEEPSQTCRTLLINAILKSLKEDNVCVMESFLPSRGDEWLKETKSHVAFIGEEVCFLLDKNDASRERVEETLNDAEDPSIFFGAIGDGDLKSIEKDGNMQLEELVKFIKKAKKIFVGAYDGEGYLVWEANRRKRKRDGLILPR
ncbi:MAG: hypothetical protein IPK56_10760 [Elusimicrobia bacterium]|nr:hypothetical protein [Elusimicrobiota bacterium]MBK9058297.1 hypothetical protein [Elusimicrobiota bacterium]